MSKYLKVALSITLEPAITWEEFQKCRQYSVDSSGICNESDCMFTLKDGVYDPAVGEELAAHVKKVHVQ
jgi:hypothetical protein